MSIRLINKNRGLLIGVFAFFTLQSCWPINKIRAKANQCCNFSPTTNKLSFNCGKDSIIFMRISFAGKTFYEQEYIPPVKEILIPIIPDSIKINRKIRIDVWNSNQVIHDYSITITPIDWQVGKLIYSNYSYR